MSNVDIIILNSNVYIILYTSELMFGHDILHVNAYCISRILFGINVRYFSANFAQLYVYIYMANMYKNLAIVA